MEGLSAFTLRTRFYLINAGFTFSSLDTSSANEVSFNSNLPENFSFNVHFNY